jgi:putative salt-induced outer membrane protein YdiY
VAGTAKALKKSAAGLRGVIVEDKGLTLSVHHRLAAPLAAAAARAALGRALKPGLILRSGRKVWEVRPAARADKGTAARKLLRRSGAARPVCIGDDRTDEDAFKAVKGRGIAVKVLSPETMSAPTAADYSLCSTAEVFKFLKRLLLLRKKAAAALLLATPVCACAAVSTAAFTGGAEFSAVSASGNTEADTFSAKNSLSIERGRLSLDLEASALTARDRAGATAERYAASEKASRLWSGRNFFFERFQWDKDRFSGVKNRYDASLGVGRRLVDGSRNRLSVELGAGYLYEERLRAPKNNFASGRGHAKYTRVLSGTSSLSQEAELVADLGHASDYRLRTDTSATAALSARFSLKASFQWKRVNRPPAGFAKDDKTTSAALIFSY